MTVRLATRHEITLDAAFRVGWKREGVALEPAAHEAMAAARAAFERLIEEPGIVIYGVTSGYGQQAWQRFTREERIAHARKPSLAAQAHAGAAFPERVTRIMVLARLANFVGGHAAVRPELADAVAHMLEASLPEVPLEGALCAGEILPLSYLFQPVGQRLELREKEALALINGAPVAAALAADAALAARSRLAIAEEILALSAEAYKMPTGHVSIDIARLQGDPHEVAAAERLSGLIAGGAAERRPYQAPVSYRVLVKMLGRLRRDLSRLEETATISLAQVSDNPTYLPPDREHPNGRILSTGGYHNAAAWPDINAVAAAYADLAGIADRHISRLLDGKTSGLPDGLLTGPDDERYLGTIGFAVAGYAEAARLAAQRVFLPASEGGGFVQNDTPVPTALAWDGQDRAGRQLDRALSSLALIASHALDVTERDAPPALRSRLATIRAAAPPIRGRVAPGPLAGAIARRISAEIYPERA
jgi:histidine ammonia-lyase